MTVKDFPEECWESVFRFLGLGHRHLNGHREGLLRQISQSGLELDLINLSNQRTFPVDGLRELGSNKKKLTVLICSNIGSLRDSHLVIIAYCFPLLDKLDISFPLNSQASDFGVLRLSSMLENLRKINISGIASAIRLRPGLSSIAFNIEKKRIHGPGLTLTPIDLNLIDSFRTLKRLTDIDLSNSVISDEFLFAVAEGAGLLLKKLILQDCCNCTFSGISYVLSKCQSVQCLDLRKVDFLSDQCISKLSVFLLSLTTINLSGCCQLTNSTFFILTRNCPLHSQKVIALVVPLNK
ncbi:uncharacterized protein HKW66_Vig0206140 [Vigna angularis]|uniref:Uncharacterized protein n=2 Tax=Phaseolus angularis TaxID=3914 RepID=A0A8T0JIK6_PHAAN|nr:uncharacterized protein HKW66_Vig0206140 [Vigna angularis]BAT93376.1 hypothetical protein VIGAN_07232600 [Vigna angularis var. angularis]